jgi:uncharacterized protein
MMLHPFAPPAHAPEAEVTLLPDAAAYWPAQRTLLIADLHLGKTETFWAAGAPVPDGVLEADLARLARLLHGTQAARLIILGDLLHGSLALIPRVIDRVAAWRAIQPMAGVEIVVVPGNHDRAINEIPPSWGLAITGVSFRDGPFLFRHDPVPTPGAYTWSGHIHPMVRLSGRADSLRLPCFWLGESVGVLPAFSRFTRGRTIQPAPADTVYAIADGKVVKVRS